MGAIFELSSSFTGSQNAFTPDDYIGDLLGFKPVVLHKEYNLWHNAVDLLAFDNTLLETDIGQDMIFKGKRTGLFHKFTMDMNLVCKYIEKFRGGVQWYMIERKNFISKISLKLKNEPGKSTSFNGQSITFRLNIKKV